MHKLILAFLLTSPSLFASVELPEVVVTPCSGNEGKIINIGGKSRYCPINTTGSAGGSGSSHVDASGGGSAGYGGGNSSGTGGSGGTGAGGGGSSGSGVGSDSSGSGSGGGGTGVNGSDSVGGLAGDAVESSVEDAQSVSAVGSSNEAVLPSSGSGDAKNRSLREADFIPVVMPREETAPLYDSVREVTDFPRVGGCVKSAKSCTCYSQQGSVLTLIDTATCTDWVDTGMPFNPYLDRSVTRAEIDYSQIPDGTRYPPIPATDSRGNVLVMAGKSPGNLMYDDLAKGRLN